jgi:hypothetical protein
VRSRLLVSFPLEVWAYYNISFNHSFFMIRRYPYVAQFHFRFPMALIPGLSGQKVEVVFWNNHTPKYLRGIEVL